MTTTVLEAVKPKPKRITAVSCPFRWSKWTNTEVARINSVERWDSSLSGAFEDDGSWLEIDDFLYRRRRGSQLVERLKIEDFMNDRCPPPLCPECGSVLVADISPAITGAIERFCPETSCPNSNGQVLRTERIYGTSDKSQEVDRSPEHRGLFDDNKGTILSEGLLHRIVQRQHGFFDMQSPEGRAMLNRAHSQLRSRVKLREDPILHDVRELLSRHNDLRMRLSKERFNLLCDKAISVIEKTQRQEGRIPKSVARQGLSDMLQMWGFPPLPRELTERKGVF